MLHNQVEKYGWESGHTAPSNSYLEPVILNTCRRLGVKSVLDLGCGKGDISCTLAASGFDVMGCDADAEGVRIATQRGSQAARLTTLCQQGFEGGWLAHHHYPLSWIS